MQNNKSQKDKKSITKLNTYYKEGNSTNLFRMNSVSVLGREEEYETVHSMMYKVVPQC